MDAFEQLQRKLPGMWREIGSSADKIESVERTIVVVPSLSVDIDFPSSAQQAYEERMLFMLFLLRKPDVSMIYVTSQRIKEEIIQYYLETIPGVVSVSARKRLFLLSPEDGSTRPLTLKLLDRPHLIKQIRALIPDIDQAHMVPFNTTDMERQLAVQLGIPMYAADPRFFAFGTKSGCRRIFAEEDVNHPIGFQDLYSIEAVIQSIIHIRAKRPGLKNVVVKLNEGVSGLGNALVDLQDLPAPASSGEAEAIATRLEQMRLEDSSLTYAQYAQHLISGGAIVEEYIAGLQVLSPSAQLRVTPLGEVEMLSTHDQMLGGPSGQSYLGATFPADPAYGWKIMSDAYKIGLRFAREGIVGRFALDFVVVKREDGIWETYAIEVNLRKGGTTAPYLILEYLTDGHYDAENSVFRTANGQPKYYVASDHVESKAYQAFTAQQLFDLVSNQRLHYNHATQSGVIMHLITGVGELGRVGVTAIADSPDDARSLYQDFIATLDRAAFILANNQKVYKQG